MNPPRLTVEDVRSLVARFADAEILVLGDVMLDEYVWGEAGRISPEAPVPVLEVVRETMRLGGAANVARNIASLGGRARLLSVAGEDALAVRLAELLRENGIEPGDLVTDSTRPTTLKTRIIASRQQVVRVDRESRAVLAERTRNEIRRRLQTCLSSAKGVVVSDYGKGVIDLELMGELARDAKKRGVFVSVDPKESHFAQYRHVALVTPNTFEASGAAGIPIRDLASLEAAGRKLLGELECEGVLVTRGPEGMSLFRPEAETTHIPVMAREVYDVTGAGDTVIATFTLARVSGASFEEAAVLSNAAAAVVVGKVGTAAVTPDELAAQVAAGFPSGSRPA